MAKDCDIDVEFEEEERLDLLNEAKKEFNQVEEKFGIGTHRYHEAVDRTYLIAEMFEMVRTHPSVLLDPEIFAQANITLENLNQLYNMLSMKDVEKE